MNLRSPLFAVSALVLAGAAGLAAARSLQEGMAPPQPTEQHRWMQSLVGTWDAEISGMMGDSKGTWEVEAGPGGLWLVSSFESEMMGAPFQGVELMGYDPGSKEFTQVWIDSMTTTPTTMTGSYDAAQKKLSMKGESAGPDGSPVPVANVSEYPDPDTVRFAMLAPGPDGRETEVMSITYKRRK